MVGFIFIFKTKIDYDKYRFWITNCQPYLSTFHYKDKREVYRRQDWKPNDFPLPGSQVDRGGTLKRPGNEIHTSAIPHLNVTLPLCPLQPHTAAGGGADSGSG